MSVQQRFSFQANTTVNIWVDSVAKNGPRTVLLMFEEEMVHVMWLRFLAIHEFWMDAETVGCESSIGEFWLVFILEQLDIF